MSLMIEKVSKAFAQKIIFNEIQLEIPNSHIVAVFGKNGSGKTTLLRMVSGLEPTSSGKIFIEKTDVHSIAPPQLKHLVNYCMPQLQLSISQTVSEFFETFLDDTLERSFIEVCERLDILELLERPIIDLSSGQWKRCLLAKALTQNSKIVCLDEPDAFLDREYLSKIRNEILSLRAKERTLLFSTHQLSFALEFCDLVIILEERTCVFYGEKEQFLKWQNAHSLKDFLD